MDPYDSDSSGFEDEDCTETGVLLGFAAEEAVDDSASHLGGWPVWFFFCSLLFHTLSVPSTRQLIPILCTNLFSVCIDMARPLLSTPRHSREMQGLQ